MIVHKPSKRTTCWVLALLLNALSACDRASEDPIKVADPEIGEYEDLIQLFHEFREWRNPVRDATGLVDYGVEAIKERRVKMDTFQDHLDDIDPANWIPSRQADYLAVRAQFDENDFVLNVTRPWSRDPVFYVNQMLNVAFTELPVEGEALDTFKKTLQSIPILSAQAKDNLTEITHDHGELAIFYLANSDGVGSGHPFRRSPPDGVIGWYADLLERAEKQQPELITDIVAGKEATENFYEWLTSERGGFAVDSGVGEELLDWYIRHALLIPHSSSQILVMAQRELARVDAFYALERHRNKGLPELEPASSEENYHQRIADTDAWIRKWLVEKEFITIPDFIPRDWREMGFGVPWVGRGTPPNFWEQVQYRDPAPDHLHAVIPGHRFDQWLERQSTHPIRRYIRDGVRYQGWAVYLEEASLQLGLFDERPRTRELIYVFLKWRAARTIGDIWNQRHEKTPQEVIDYWIQNTPYMDENVARNYAYLRPAPAHGLHYTYGHLQMRKLLGERQQQLGNDFVLKSFHDGFLAAERIPISLIRYEMTGYDDEVRALWQRVRLSDKLL